MELILGATEAIDNDYLTNFGDVAEEVVKEWLVTFQGWGLLSSILDSNKHGYVVQSLAYTSTTWEGEFSKENVFDTTACLGKHPWERAV